MKYYTNVGLPPLICFVKVVQVTGLEITRYEDKENVLNRYM
jgi:hypothetical protein